MELSIYNIKGEDTGRKIELSDPYFCKLVSETELVRESSGPADTLCEIADLFFTEQN